MSELHPGQDGSMDLGFGPDPKPVVGDNPPAGGQITLTHEQFQELLSRFSQQHQEADYAAALTGEPQEPVPPPEIDLSNLPNPAQDLDGFKQGLGQILQQGAQQIVEQTTQHTQRVNDVNQAYDQAWTLMRERYPNLAEHPEVIQMAATREWEGLRARGIDPAIALQHNMDAAVEAVATRAQVTINKIRGLQEGDDSSEDYRTETLEGRGAAPSRVPDRARQQNQQTSFVDDLKKLQREMGIY